jgi:ABC-2 type transport system ATP-binding protein
MILNIIAPDEGSIRVLGKPSKDPTSTDRIGYLPEERGLYKKMKVRIVFQFLGERRGMTRQEADRQAEYWLERPSLKTPEKDWGQSKVDELSRGMQQKVQFIGTLLHDPDLVILDEPFSGLDPINAQALKDTVVELRKRGKTVIFSTHIMDSAERLCDSVCIIAHGEKVLDGGVSAVKSAHGRRHIALALNDAVPSGVTAVLSDRTLVTRADDQNQFFELELARDATPQQLLEGVQTRAFILGCLLGPVFIAGVLFVPAWLSLRNLRADPANLIFIDATGAGLGQRLRANSTPLRRRLTRGTRSMCA